MSPFAIAGLQLSLINGDNLEAILRQIKGVKQRFPWIDMIILSELATFGTDPAHAVPEASGAEQAYAALARDLNIWLLPGSIYVRQGDLVYNTAPVINSAGQIITRYRKMFPFMPYEEGVAPGNEFTLFDVPGVGRFGVSICFDKWFPETTRALVWQGAEVILHPTLTTTLDRDVELAIARSNAAINQCYFFDINTAAPYGSGRSVVYGPGGELIHQAATTQEVIPVEIDLDYLRRVRERGWQGLCQTLKMFRDTPLDLPQHIPGARSEYLDALGKLATPSGHPGDTTK